MTILPTSDNDGDWLDIEPSDAYVVPYGLDPDGNHRRPREIVAKSIYRCPACKIHLTIKGGDKKVDTFPIRMATILVDIIKLSELTW